MKIRKWDVAEHLQTKDDIAHYLDAVLEQNDSKLLATALGDVARAKGMTDIARETGLGRESLYKALSASGNPSFSTVQKVLAVLGLKFSVTSV